MHNNEYQTQVYLHTDDVLYKCYYYKGKRYKTITTTYEKIHKLVKLRAKNYHKDNYKYEQ